MRVSRRRAVKIRGVKLNTLAKPEIIFPEND
jgi:hypothetical protein